MREIPEGYSLIETSELERLHAIDATHGWKERPPQDWRHTFVPHPKWPWFCNICGYAPHETIKHFQPKEPT